MAAPSAQLCINAIRVLAADTVQKANSGHPGAPMGMAPMAHVLWSNVMNYSPANPSWINRDRFVLSNGHACALQYCMLHLTGYKDFPLDQLQKFRQLGSNTPGHPEAHGVGGIEVTTGPLGQGIANAVGLAIASHHVAARFNRPGFDIFDNYVYCFVGDGCMMEGISSEAASLAGHLGLGRLIVLYDDNSISIDGDTSLAFTESVLKRHEAYGWHVQQVTDGDNDIAGIQAAIDAAKKVTDRPSIIAVKTTIGFGSSKSGTEKVHGNPLGKDDLAQVKAKFGFDPSKSFDIPDEVAKFYSSFRDLGLKKEAQWNDLFSKYGAAHPDLASELTRRLAGHLPADLEKSLPVYKPTGDAATRKLSGIVINSIAPILPELFGGSADLNPSNLTYMECTPDFQRNSPEGRNVRFGVREHAMAAICNGLAAYGGFKPYCSTFLNFIQYCLPAVRLSALSHHPVTYVFTHDSLALGEDGPTHQPISALAVCRATPNLVLVRPADGNETSGAYACTLRDRNRPYVFCLTRQNLPHLKGTSIEGVSRGAYVLPDYSGGAAPEIVLVGTGSELHLCVAAAEKIGPTARVVSFPSWELFEDQKDDYRASVFPAGVPVLAVEAGASIGWSKYAHATQTIDTFGASGPGPQVMAHFGFTVDNVIDKAARLLAFYKTHPVPDLGTRPF